jgi:hypothetical protein
VTESYFDRHPPVALQADAAWWPKELRRLVRLLDVAHQGSRPGSGDPSTRGVKTDRRSDYPPGAVENERDNVVEASWDMERSGRILAKYAKRLGVLADELEAELQGRGKQRRGWQCECGRFNAEWTRYCGSCGERRETIRVLRDKPAGQDGDV